MYKTILLLFASLSTQNLYSQSKFDGYIVKLKKNSHFLSSKKSLFLNTEKIDFKNKTFLHLKFQNFSTKQEIDGLRKHPDVEYIEPNYYISGLDHDGPTTIPDNIKDKFFKSQWGLRNTGHNNWGNLPAGVDIKAIEGWKKFKANRELIVAVVDSGINYNHVDIKSNLWKNQVELLGLPGVDDDGNGLVDDIYGYDFHNSDNDPMDDHDRSHGTHIAGIVGASHNNIGIRGLVPNVQIMGLKLLGADNIGTTINSIKSIKYAIDNGAQIVNLSWGSLEKSKALKEVLEYGNEKEVLFVAAAGNSNDNNEVNPIYPASYDLPNIISVGAFSPRNKKASFSNYGQKNVHIFAPGVYILSLSKVNGKYSWSSGTSQAAPFVSGALGLLLSKYDKMNYLEAKQRLIKTSTQESVYLDIAKGGKINLEKLLSL